MKKLAAIFLLVIFLFNLVGYRGLFFIAERQWESQLKSSLDKDQYNEADLIIIRAPLQLPYVTDTREFQRTDGEVTVDGKIYRYVKSKIENGEYVLMCIPDHNKQKLEKAKADFFKDANDVLQNGSSKKSTDSKSGLFKNILPEFNCNNLHDQQIISSTRSCSYPLQPAMALPTAPHLSPLQPPDFLRA